MTSIDDIADALAMANVYAGQPTERREFAGDLLAKAVTATDIELLSAHCQMTVKDGAPAQLAVLVSILRNDKRRDERLGDLRQIAAKKARIAAQDSRAFGDPSYVPGPTQGESREDWDHDRQCRIAWCCVHGDQRDPASVARVSRAAASRRLVP